MIVNAAPRYIVMQNIATPIRHITVAIIVAYGIRVIHDLQQLPRKCGARDRTKNEFQPIFLIFILMFFVLAGNDDETEQKIFYKFTTMDKYKDSNNRERKYRMGRRLMNKMRSEKKVETYVTNKNETKLFDERCMNRVDEIKMDIHIHF